MNFGVYGVQRRENGLWMAAEKPSINTKTVIPGS